MIDKRQDKRQDEIDRILFLMRGFYIEEYGSKTHKDGRKLAEKIVDHNIRSAKGFEILTKATKTVSCDQRLDIYIEPIDYRGQDNG